MGSRLGCKNHTYHGPKHIGWKGDAVGYGALHTWVRRRLPKQKLCQNCGNQRKLELANISQKYKRDLLDFEWLCRSCHMKKDGRVKTICSANGVRSCSILKRDSSGRFIRRQYVN